MENRNQGSVRPTIIGSGCHFRRKGGATFPEVRVAESVLFDDLNVGCGYGIRENDCKPKAKACKWTYTYTSF